MAAFAALLAIACIFPTPVPFAAAHLLAAWSAATDAPYRFTSYSVSNGCIAAKANSTVFAPFSLHGAPGPGFAFDAPLDGRMLNLYPVLALALVIAIPDQRTGNRLLALFACILLVALAAVLDLYVLSQWQHARVIQANLAELLPRLEGTPQNQAAGDALMAWLARLKTVNAFLNTGGRQFLAILIAAVCGAAFLQSPSPRAAASAHPPT